MKQTLQWGVIGTGVIAGAFVEALGGSARCRVVNVVGSSPAKGAAFAQRWGVPASAASVDELLADRDVEAVYVSSPHPAHEGHAGACIAAGRHVLCEKPLTVDMASATRLVAAARGRGVLLMEAFMYRCHPLMRELVGRLQDGAIGALCHLTADFGFRAPRDPAGRLFNLELGGGGILDVGGYPVSFARLLAGVAAGQPFAEPTRLQAMGIIGPTGADELALALLSFASGFSARLTCAIRHEVGRQCVIFGEEGKIVLTDPWIPQSERQSLETGFTIVRDGRGPEDVVVRAPLPTYGMEAELFADTLPATEPAWPAMTLDDTLGNMRVLESWCAALRTAR